MEHGDLGPIMLFLLSSNVQTKPQPSNHINCESIDFYVLKKTFGIFLSDLILCCFVWTEIKDCV